MVKATNSITTLGIAGSSTIRVTASATAAITTSSCWDAGDGRSLSSLLKIYKGSGIGGGYNRGGKGEDNWAIVFNNKSEYLNRKMQRAVIIVRGDVQRVGYRNVVERVARRLNVTGFVENLKPYDVRIVVEGEKDILEEFIEKIQVKQPPIIVERVDVEYKKATGEFEYFEIKKGDIIDELGERLDVAGSVMYEIRDLQKESLGKQDQMLGKQDQMLGKQDQMINKLDSFHHDTVQKFDTMDVKYDKVSDKLDKMDKTLEKLANAILKLAEKTG